MQSSNQQRKFLGIFSLAMINTAAIINISNLPSMVIVGYGLISYMLLAAVFFFWPMAFVSAELATGWPQKGGFYSWVRIAFGPIVGFLAIWLQWIANVIWYPTLLTPIIVSALDVFAPGLSNQAWLLFALMVGIFWVLTILNLCGMRASSFISSFGVIFGSIFPALVLMIFALIWIFSNQPVGLHFAVQDLVPHLDHLDQMSLLISMLVTLVGLEMSAVHVNDVANPRKTYPQAILIATIIIMVTFILTSLAMAVIVPPDKMDLVNGVIQTLQVFCATMHVQWMIPVITILIIIGIMTNASTWISGPSKGFQVAAVDGDIPAFFQKLNKHEMPTPIIIAQAVVFTIMSLLFLFVPSVQKSYWILLALTGQLYMAMYFILFLTGIRLRLKYPQVVREYAIPGKWNLGMWIIGIFGLLGTSGGFIMTYFPPAQVTGLSFANYIALLAIGFIVICFGPVALFTVFYYYKRKKFVAEEFVPEDHDLSLPEAQRLPFIVAKYNKSKSTLKPNK